MKLNFSPNLSSFERVRPADAGNDAPKRERRDESPSQRDREENEDSPEEGAAKVAAAVSEFGENLPALASGLTAEMHGNGPGLQVTLKDGRGALVRQFTGEEFLRLREAASGTSRGSLLDKKL